MIPELNVNLITIERTNYASLTYKLDLQTKRIIGKVDGLDAIIQAAIKILYTERYAYVIYSSQYGVELEPLIGKDYDYIISDIQRRLEEALLVDNRMESISNVEFQKTGLNSMTIKFNINTAEGVITVSREVPI